MFDLGQDILDRLRPEFLRATRASLEECEDMIARLDAGQIAGAEALVDLRRKIHNIKGQATTFGFPSVTRIAHLLEDRLGVLNELGRSQLRPVDAYLIAIDRIIGAGSEPTSQAAQQIIDGLPLILDAEARGRAQPAPPRILTILGSSTIEAIISASLRDLSAQIESADSAGAGLIATLRRPPALLIASLVMEDVSGIEIACALRAIPRTRRLPVILCGARRGRGTDLGDLPPGVPVFDTAELVSETQFSETVRRLLHRRPTPPSTDQSIERST